MREYTKYCWIIVLLLSCSAHSAPIKGKNSYWQCTSEDDGNKIWTAKNAYQKTALNIAYAACRKESSAPSTCHSSIANCEGFNLGRSTRAMWQCTALDKASDAEPWRNSPMSQQEDAALAAKAYCKNNSKLPETCYINMITCVNVNE